MIKVVVQILNVFLFFGLVGCDLSMNKNKNALKDESNKNASVQTPIENQPPIHINDIVHETSSQTKQAEEWQKMNLANSTNDNGQSIQFENNATASLPHSNEPTIEDYFADYKPNE